MAASALPSHGPSKASYPSRRATGVSRSATPSSKTQHSSARSIPRGGTLSVISRCSGIPGRAIKSRSRPLMGRFGSGMSTRRQRRRARRDCLVACSACELADGVGHRCHVFFVIPPLDDFCVSSVCKACISFIQVGRVWSEMRCFFAATDLIHSSYRQPSVNR